MSEEPKDKSSSTVTTKPMKIKTQVMVDNALKSLNERSGSSLIAIKKFLSGTYSINVEKSSWAIKKYIKESVESGKFIQTKGNNLSGSFKLSRNALKESEPKPKKVKLKESAAGNAKKTKADKQPKATKGTASNKIAETGSNKKVKPKKTAALKLTIATNKKTITDGEVPKKKLTKKQESEAVKATPKKKTPIGKKANKSPTKKKGKENIPPTKKKPQIKKKEELPAAPVVDHEDSDDSLTVSPKIKVKEALSFIESANDVDPDEPASFEEDNDEMEPEEEPARGQLNESDGSVSSEESPDKSKVNPKGKVATKSVKKRKSIATLVNTAKPKIAKK